MPAKSKAQQKAAGAALSAKRGETKTSELVGASRQMYEGMTEDQLEDFASTKRKGKPEHVAGSLYAKKAKKASAAKKKAKSVLKSRPRSAVKTTAKKAKTASKKAPAKKSTAKQTARKKVAKKASR